MTAAFDRGHVELAFGQGALSVERMLAAQRRELEELRCRASGVDGEARVVLEMDAAAVAVKVDRLDGAAALGYGRQCTCPTCPAPHIPPGAVCFPDGAGGARCVGCHNHQEGAVR